MLSTIAIYETQFSNQNKSHRYTTLNYTTLHYTTLHYTTLHYTTLHYTTLHYTDTTLIGVADLGLESVISVDLKSFLSSASNKHQLQLASRKFFQNKSF